MALSSKQREILRFPYTDYTALICDGAVRSGKTSIMSLSFVLQQPSLCDLRQVCWRGGAQHCDAVA